MFKLLKSNFGFALGLILFGYVLFTKLQAREGSAFAVMILMYACFLTDAIVCLKVVQPTMLRIAKALPAFACCLVYVPLAGRLAEFLYENAFVEDVVAIILYGITFGILVAHLIGVSHERSRKRGECLQANLGRSAE